MNDMNLEELLIKAINASINGGFEILKIYNTNFSYERKEDKSPLTIADQNCHNIIDQELRLTNIPILSEEGKHTPFEDRKKWNHLWIVDPLDGTKEFIKKNGEFTVNISLVRNKVPILGVIYVPVTKDLYFGLENIGSFKYSNVDNEFHDLESLITKSKKLPLQYKRDNYVIVGSRSHMSKETEAFLKTKKNEKDNVDILSVGSSLKICMVAEGRADVYPRYAPTMEWDTAAGHAIAKFAGFTFLEYNSENELIYNKESLLNPWFIVE